MPDPQPKSMNEVRTQVARAPEQERSISEPTPVTDARLAALHRLLHAEAEIRDCKSLDELGFLIVSELSRASGARQAFVVEIRRRISRVTKSSGSGSLDPQSPTLQWLQKELSHHLGSRAAKPAAMTLRVGKSAITEDGRHFPFPFARWFPFHDMGRGRITGVLVVSDKEFAEGPVTISQRLAETASHAAKVLVARPQRQSMGRKVHLLMLFTTLVVLGLMTKPLPMTALAPMEIVAKSPFVVAAPIDGVIDEIVVSPNSQVKAGDILVRYVDTLPRNSYQIADRELAVAEAKLRQLTQLALVDEKAKRELSQARSEVALKLAERDYHKDTFEQSVIRAKRDGIAVYGDRKEWIGKPITTGQRILEIADTADVEVLAHLPVSAFIELEPGARTRVFLDDNPLHPLEAKIISTNHQATMSEGLGLSYRIRAELTDTEKPPRLGARGTAQLFGEEAPLAYYLFRRPLAWARQKIGL